MDNEQFEDGYNIVIGLQEEDGEWGLEPECCKQISIDCELPWKLNNVLPYLGYTNVSRSYKILRDIDDKHWLNASVPNSLTALLNSGAVSMIGSSYFSITSERLKLLKFSFLAYSYNLNIYIRKPVAADAAVVSPYYFLLRPYKFPVWFFLFFVYTTAVMLRRAAHRRINRLNPKNKFENRFLPPFQQHRRRWQMMFFSYHLLVFFENTFIMAALAFYSANLKALSIQSADYSFVSIKHLDSLARAIREGRYTLLTSTYDDIVFDTINKTNQPVTMALRKALKMNPAKLSPDPAEYCKLLVSTNEHFAMISSAGNMYQFCPHQTCNLISIPINDWSLQLAAFAVSPRYPRLLARLNLALENGVYENEQFRFETHLSMTSADICKIEELGSEQHEGAGFVESSGPQGQQASVSFITMEVLVGVFIIVFLTALPMCVLVLFVERLFSTRRKRHRFMELILNRLSSFVR